MRAQIFEGKIITDWETVLQSSVLKHCEVMQKKKQGS